MLAIIGKADPNPDNGDIEYLLRDFRAKLHTDRRFVYAWSFNPDRTAIDLLRSRLNAGEDVYLYLPAARRQSNLRMRIEDFRNRYEGGGMLCPDEWRRYCVNLLENRREVGANRFIHIWFVISAIEDCPSCPSESVVKEAILPIKWGCLTGGTRRMV